MQHEWFFPLVDDNQNFRGKLTDIFLVQAVDYEQKI